MALPYFNQTLSTHTKGVQMMNGRPDNESPDAADVHIKKLKAKIERLEGALRRIAQNICISRGADLEMQRIAREALDKEQT